MNDESTNRGLDRIHRHGGIIGAIVDLEAGCRKLASLAISPEWATALERAAANLDMTVRELTGLPQKNGSTRL